MTDLFFPQPREVLETWSQPHRRELEEAHGSEQPRGRVEFLMSPSAPPGEKLGSGGFSCRFSSPFLPRTHEAKKVACYFSAKTRLCWSHAHSLVRASKRRENKALIEHVKETLVYQSDCARPRIVLVRDVTTQCRLLSFFLPSCHLCWAAERGFKISCGTPARGREGTT
jgi:hypothetical protein